MEKDVPGKAIGDESDKLQNAGGKFPAAFCDEVQLALRVRSEVQERHQHTAAIIQDISTKRLIQLILCLSQRGEL